MVRFYLCGLETRDFSRGRKGRSCEAAQSEGSLPSILIANTILL
jgi:hypothetical protein